MRLIQRRNHRTVCVCVPFWPSRIGTHSDYMPFLASGMARSAAATGDKNESRSKHVTQRRLRQLNETAEFARHSAQRSEIIAARNYSVWPVVRVSYYDNQIGIHYLLLNCEVAVQHNNNAMSKSRYSGRVRIRQRRDKFKLSSITHAHIPIDFGTVTLELTDSIVLL